jgi:hypothetical protein
MVKKGNLRLCNLHKEGFCHVEKAGPKVVVTGMLGGKMCKGTVCEDFEGKCMCGAFPIEKAI